MVENVRRTNMKETFVCKHCEETFPRTELGAKGWLVCKPCIAKFQKAYREKNKKRLNAQNKEYREVNKEEINKQRKEYRKKNKEVIAQRQKANWAKNGKKYSAKGYQRKVERLKTDIQFKLRETIRSRISVAIRGEVKRGSAIELLGCSVEEFKAYIEAQFQPGMTWENWSLHGWHLDHIKPIKDFDLTDPKQLAEVCHYTNMRPLWAKDNLARRFSKY